MIKYSKTTNGFYDDAIHAPGQIPEDAVVITKKQHTDLLNGQSFGKRIVSDENGFPILVDPPPLSPLEQAKQAASWAIQTGLTVEFSQYPELNSTYSCDTDAMSRIAQVEAYVLRNGYFPGAVTAFRFADKSGNPHVFPNTETWGKFATAMIDYVATVEAYAFGNSLTPLPASTITIA